MLEATGRSLTSKSSVRAAMPDFREGTSFDRRQISGNDTSSDDSSDGNDRTYGPKVLKKPPRKYYKGCSKSANKEQLKSVAELRDRRPDLSRLVASIEDLCKDRVLRKPHMHVVLALIQQNKIFDSDIVAEKEVTVEDLISLFGGEISTNMISYILPVLFDLREDITVIPQSLFKVWLLNPEDDQLRDRLGKYLRPSPVTEGPGQDDSDPWKKPVPHRVVLCLPSASSTCQIAALFSVETAIHPILYGVGISKKVTAEALREASIQIRRLLERVKWWHARQQPHLTYPIRTYQDKAAEWTRSAVALQMLSFCMNIASGDFWDLLRFGQLSVREEAINPAEPDKDLDMDTEGVVAPFNPRKPLYSPPGVAKPDLENIRWALKSKFFHHLRGVCKIRARWSPSSQNSSAIFDSIGHTDQPKSLASRTEADIVEDDSDSDTESEDSNLGDAPQHEEDEEDEGEGADDEPFESNDFRQQYKATVEESCEDFGSDCSSPHVAETTSPTTPESSFDGVPHYSEDEILQLFNDFKGRYNKIPYELTEEYKKALYAKEGPKPDLSKLTRKIPWMSDMFQILT